MPKAAKILSVGAQASAQGDQRLMLWAEVDTDQPMEQRQIEVFGTGHEIPQGMGVSREFIGTVIVSSLVWHVYEYTGV